MKKLLISALAFIVLFSCTQISTTEQVEKATDGVFIHITRDHSDPHRVLMPVQMALMMAEDKDVLIYLDIDAVHLVTKDAEDLEYAHFTPLKAAIGQLLDMGVGIYACPGCMKAHGINEEDLMDGIQVAQKEKFFNFTDGRILTLDY